MPTFKVKVKRRRRESNDVFSWSGWHRISSQTMTADAAIEIVSGEFERDGSEVSTTLCESEQPGGIYVTA
jgi:hypothetical protein